MNGPLAIGLQQIPKREVRVSNRGEHVLDLAIEIEDPNRVHVVIGIVEQLQRGESNLAIGDIPRNKEEDELGLEFRVLRGSFSGV